MTLSVGTSVTGVTRLESHCDYRSEPAHADFDPTQLVEPLEVLDGEAVDLELGGPGGTAVLHAAGLDYYVRALDADDKEDAATGRAAGEHPEERPAATRVGAEPRNETT